MIFIRVPKFRKRMNGNVHVHSLDMIVYICK